MSKQKRIKFEPCDASGDDGSGVTAFDAGPDMLFDASSYAAGGACEFANIDEMGDEEPEPCVLCAFCGADQANPKLQDVMSQIENKVALASSMGLKHKAAAIELVYQKTLVPLLPPDTPVWTRTSILNHLRGMHGTASVSNLKQVDIASMGLYMHALDKFALKKDPESGRVVDVNHAVFRLRLNFSKQIHELSDKTGM